MMADGQQQESGKGTKFVSVSVATNKSDGVLRLDKMEETGDFPGWFMSGLRDLQEACGAYGEVGAADSADSTELLQKEAMVNMFDRVARLERARSANAAEISVENLPEGFQNILKPFDVDGRGMISILELKKGTEAHIAIQKQYSALMKLVFALCVVIVFVTLVGEYGISIYTAEAAKDFKPAADGSLTRNDGTIISVARASEMYDDICDRAPEVLLEMGHLHIPVSESLHVFTSVQSISIRTDKVVRLIKIFPEYINGAEVVGLTCDCGEPENRSFSVLSKDEYEKESRELADHGERELKRSASSKKGEPKPNQYLKETEGLKPASKYDLSWNHIVERRREFFENLDEEYAEIIRKEDARVKLEEDATRERLVAEGRKNKFIVSTIKRQREIEQDRFDELDAAHKLKMQNIVIPKNWIKRR